MKEIILFITLMTILGGCAGPDNSAFFKKANPAISNILNK